MRNLLFFILTYFCGYSYANSSFQEGVDAVNHKNYPLAIENFEKECDSNSLNISAWSNLGHCYLEQKQYGKALHAYIYAQKLDPSNNKFEEKITSIESTLQSNYYQENNYSKFQIFTYKIGGITWNILAVLCSIITAFCVFNVISNNHKKFNVILLIPLTIILIFTIYASLKEYQYVHQQRFIVISTKTLNPFINTLGEYSDEAFNEGYITEINRTTKDYFVVKGSVGQDLFIKKSDVKTY